MNIKDIKVVLLGDSGVGKSSLVLRFVTDTFKPYSDSTIGASYMTKLINFENKAYKYMIWDTAGQEKYHSLASMYYRNTQVAIIVYDITQKQTFLTVKKWIKELQQKGPPDVLIAIVGNKQDLEDRRKVSYNQAKAYAAEINAFFIETSAKKNININELFINIGKSLPDDLYIQKFSNIENISLSQNKDNYNLCCL
jgi:Ras-related protein Rab-22